MSKANRIPAVSTLIILVFLAALELSASAMSTAAQFTLLPCIAMSQIAAESPADPVAILATARLLYVHSRTGLVKSEVIESELQKRTDLRQAGLIITADPNAADLRMEVRRSNFTTEYPYVVIDTRTQIVVASGKVNSLFGTAASKIAKGFAKQVLQARNLAAKVNH